MELRKTLAPPPIYSWIYKFRLGLFTPFQIGTGATGEVLEALTSDPGTDTLWHYVLARYTNATKTLLLRVDNNPDASVTYASALPTSWDSYRYQKLDITTPEYVELCEIAYWNRCLTDDQVTYDWNGGNGKTWYGGGWHDS